MEDDDDDDDDEDEEDDADEEDDDDVAEGEEEGEKEESLGLEFDYLDGLGRVIIPGFDDALEPSGSDAVGAEEEGRVIQTGPPRREEQPSLDDRSISLHPGETLVPVSNQGIMISTGSSIQL